MIVEIKNKWQLFLDDIEVGSDVLLTEIQSILRPVYDAANKSNIKIIQ